MSEPSVPEHWQDPFAILGILTSAKTIAIVGLSPNELRASHDKFASAFEYGTDAMWVTTLEEK